MVIPQLERYEIIEEIGQGGMSVVYRARDRQLNRDVAVKVLHDFLARQEESRRRLHREAVAVAKLQHPGIVEIFDYSGPDAKQSYIVCELIRGRTLRTVIEDRGPIRFPELGALITADLTRALRHAHEQGIIHRDLKPENVMVTADGRLKLMDFGIAQIMGGATQLTATGTLLGSPAHMAPEMIDGHPSDHRSDIFSVGTILYWLATGAMPFEAPNPTALFRQILEGKYEPPQALQPRVGNGLSRIIERALQVDPADRYQDISELQAALDRELEAVDLMPIASKAQAFLAEPRCFADEFEPKLVKRLADTGQKALNDGNVGRAMDRFNRVLAIVPDHVEVLALVKRVGRRRAFAARFRKLAIAGLVGVALVAGGIGVLGLGRAPTDSVAATSKAPTIPEPSVSEPLAATNTAADKPPVAPPTRRPAPTRPKKRSESSASLPPPTATATTTSTPPKAPRPRHYPLLLRMHPGWADVSVNGEQVATGAYRAQLRLRAGAHKIAIRNQYGQAEPRVIVVRDDGSMVEKRPDGESHPIKGELPVYTPGPETKLTPLTDDAQTPPVRRSPRQK